MKTNLLKLACGVALLGAVTSASAQTSLVAGWDMYNPSSQTFPYAASTIDVSVSSAVMNYAGLFGFDVSSSQGTTLDDLYRVACYNASTTYGGTYNVDMTDYTAGLMGDITPVPEPSMLALACLSGLGLLLFRRRKQLGDLSLQPLRVEFCRPRPRSLARRSVTETARPRP